VHAITHAACNLQVLQLPESYITSVRQLTTNAARLARILLQILSMNLQLTAKRPTDPRLLTILGGQSILSQSSRTDLVYCRPSFWLYVFLLRYRPRKDH